MMLKRWAAISVVAAIVVFAAPAVQTRVVTFLSPVLENCPAEGDATATTRADPDLNLQKNRVTAPTNGFTSTHFDDLADLDVPAGVSKRHRSTWPADTRTAVTTEEARAVRVAGYLIAQKLEGPESCNCHGDAENEKDIHLWLGNSADDTKSDAIVVEVAPRIRAQHATWTRTKFRQLATAKARIRVSGWVLLDEEHADQVGQSRHTIGEIHPILKIEIFTAGHWNVL